MDQQWESLQHVLSNLFDNLNTGGNLLTPQEIWSNEQELLQSILQTPQAENNLVRVGDDVWIPKAYEAIRILRLLRQRLNVNRSGRVLVDQIRAEVIQRKRPTRNFRRENLIHHRIFSNEDYRLIAEIGGKATYSEFQLRGWREVLETISNRESIIITAPTGSGKTEVFMLPVIYSVASRLTSKPPRFILIYPRVELLKDQVSRLLKYAYRAEQRLALGTDALFGGHRNIPKPIIIGLQFKGIRSSYSETLDDINICENELFKIVPFCPICEENNHEEKLTIIPGQITTLTCNNCGANFHLTLGKNDHATQHPHLLVTTVESLDRLYLNPKLEDYLSEIDGIVFDEVHLFNSLYGAHVYNLIRRIENMQKNSQKSICKIGASATVSNPRRFAARLFHGADESSQVREHNPIGFEEEIAGLEVIVFIQTPDDTSFPSTQSTLIQTIMAVGHGLLGPDERAIVFTESVDHANRTVRMVYDADTTRGLWQFRTILNNLSFERQMCPQTNPLACQGIYYQGECWRGVRGGLQCTASNVDLIERNLDLNVVTAMNSNAYWDGDIVIATSALEVGVDDDRFRITIHYRPPRSVFSFLQRRGRAGRRDGDSAYTIMVLGRTPMDEFYFRRRNRLTDAGQYELPLNPHNSVIGIMHRELEQERQKIGKLAQNRKLPQALMIWMLDKFQNCHTIRQTIGIGDRVIALHRNALAADQKQIQTTQAEFKAWVTHQRERFTRHLNLDILLQELLNRMPDSERTQVIDFKDKIYAFRMGVETNFHSIKQVALNLLNRLNELELEHSDDRLFEELCTRLRGIILNVTKDQSQLEQLGLNQEQISAFYDFFSHLDAKINDAGYAILNDIPPMIKIVMQSLFYIHQGCDETCKSCIDYFIPDAYFQEVKPIQVETWTNQGEGQRELYAEDSTRLASMLIPYKPFFRYFNDGDYMAIVDTIHSPNWVEQTSNGLIVRLELHAEGVSDPQGGKNPSKVYVQPIRSDEAGRGIIYLCEHCYQLHSEDYGRRRRRCSCGNHNLTAVRLRSEPLVERVPSLDESSTQRLTESFIYCHHLEGYTRITGAEVQFTRQFLNNDGEYFSPQPPESFTALYYRSGQTSEPLVYRLNTRGIVWDLGRTVQSVSANNNLRHLLEQYNKSLEPELILHTAAHMLHKAIASLSGVNDYVLEYAFLVETSEVFVWERYEGGVGISEIIRDILQEDPKQLYRELLASVLCPIYYSDEGNWYSDETLKTRLADDWALDREDPLISAVVSEAVAERNSMAIGHAERDQSCSRTDGCPVCIHTTTCTDHLDQPTAVSRYVAEAIMNEFRQTVNQTQFDAISANHIDKGITPPVILRHDMNQEIYDVLRL